MTPFLVYQQLPLLYSPCRRHWHKSLTDVFFSECREILTPLRHRPPFWGAPDLKWWLWSLDHRSFLAFLWETGANFYVSDYVNLCKMACYCTQKKKKESMVP